MSFTRLAMQRGIARDQVAKRLGISQHDLHLLDSGWGVLEGEDPIQNARERLGVTRNQIQHAIDDAAERRAATQQQPDELREAQDRVNEEWTKHCSDPLKYLRERGVALGPGYVPVNVLAQELARRHLGGLAGRIRFALPGVDHPEQFVVLGYRISIPRARGAEA